MSISEMMHVLLPHVRDVAQLHGARGIDVIQVTMDPAPAAKAALAQLQRLNSTMEYRQDAAADAPLVMVLSGYLAAEFLRARTRAMVQTGNINAPSP